MGAINVVRQNIRGRIGQMPEFGLIWTEKLWNHLLILIMKAVVFCKIWWNPILLIVPPQIESLADPLSKIQEARNRKHRTKCKRDSWLLNLTSAYNGKSLKIVKKAVLGVHHHPSNSFQISLFYSGNDPKSKWFQLNYNYMKDLQKQKLVALSYFLGNVN